MKTNLHRAIRRTSTTAGQIRITATAVGLTHTDALTGGTQLEVGWDRRDSSYLDGDIPEMVIAHDPSDDDVLHLEPT